MEKMIYVCIYCDTTPWYTEEEMCESNLCDLLFPERMVKDFYAEMGGDLQDFAKWLEEEYTADDTDGLWEFCRRRGFVAVREAD